MASAPRGGSAGRVSSRHVRVVAVVLVLALALGFAGWAALGHLGAGSGDGSSAAPPPPSSTASPTGQQDAGSPRLARFYGQRLRWRACGTDQDCATLRVPLDYARPEGPTLDLSVLRLRASGRDQRVGQLVMDPGGPGASAREFAAAGSLVVGPVVRRYFDLVGMDPRGVGRSHPLHCLDTAGTDAFLAMDPTPDTPAEVATSERLTRSFGQACLRGSGDLLAHVSTVEAAKDMDVLRSALGESQLDYLGVSYGTLLGATYAELFPGRVRRMVLDGAEDPALPNKQFLLDPGSRLPDCFDVVRRPLRQPARLPHRTHDVRGHRPARRPAAAG